MGRRLSLPLSLAVLALFASSGASAAVSTIGDVIQGVLVEAGQTLILDENGELVQEPTTTGISFTNLSQSQGAVNVQFLPGASRRPGDEVGGGFLLLDGTLRVSSTVPAGEQRVRIRMAYSDGRLGREGVRADSVRLLRRRALVGRRFARWLPAVGAIHGRADVRRFPNTSPLQSPGRLGNFGFDGQNQFVWAYLDVNSDYAVGARVIPEPVSLAFFGGGLGLLAIRRYRRHS